jgi:hypothetical protein
LNGRFAGGTQIKQEGIPQKENHAFERVGVRKLLKPRAFEGGTQK